MRKLRLALLGCGQVGGGLVSILHSKQRYFAERVGVEFEIAGIAVRDKKKKRAVRIPSRLLTTDAVSLVDDPSVDIVVELIGGVRRAGELVKRALRNGKHVVTANKALLAEDGDAVFRLADKMGRLILFEASVGGGIPVIKSLREGLVANRFESIYSIINGTSNYILSKMGDEGCDFREALKGAQEKGYAEADPTLDIDGTDALHKLAIMVRFGFDTSVRFSDLTCEGIQHIRSEDISFARELGYTIKLLAIAKRSGNGIEARVQPTLLHNSHVLAGVSGSFNAVLLQGDEVGDVLLYGRGAGPHPTASAVISDLVDVAKFDDARLRGARLPIRGCRRCVRIMNLSSIQSRYYLRFHVVDRPGVLSDISRVLGRHGISIASCVQKDRSAGSVVPLIFLTHASSEKDVRRAIRAIERIKAVKGKPQVIRIERKKS